MTTTSPQGLYDQHFEHDACGLGLVANIKGVKTNAIIQEGITILKNLEHRGACGCDPKTGDGAGILFQLPHEFLKDECFQVGFKIPSLGNYGVGMIFFPNDAAKIEECKNLISRKIKQFDLELLGYRKVPVNNSNLGQGALVGEPSIEQMFVLKPSTLKEQIVFERKLFVFRNYISHLINESISTDFYIASFSSKTIVYKGQLNSSQLDEYFPDLSQDTLTSAFSLVHSRFSTNTFPSWKLAHPFRMIAHNGEINTLQGNLNWFKSYESLLSSTHFSKEEIEMLLPITNRSFSDSANLDAVVELLALSGRSLPHVMMMMIPEAWENNPDLDPNTRAFYEYHANLMEPWDGPAGVIFTDGNLIGATLDRNGLRPIRYYVLKNDKIVMASEVGVLNVNEEDIIEKNRIQPGKMFLIDIEKGKIYNNEEVKGMVCNNKNYATWIQKNKLKLKDLPEAKGTFLHIDETTLLRKQISAGMTKEDVNIILKQMIETGKEAIGSMGYDAPLAILSDQSQHLSNYFKQSFAQVTNPPIDSIRERTVMSLLSYVGGQVNLLDESADHAICLQLDQPVITNNDLEKIRFVDNKNFQTKTIYIYFKADGRNGALERALNRICQYAEDAVEDGFAVIILSDRSFDSSHAQMPSLLAVSAVHHHLIKKGLRGKVGLLVEASDVWETHHFATLIAYGASGINPYLTFETIQHLNEKKILAGNYDNEKYATNYIKAVNGELLKIFSKMGISTLQSYQGSQVFEALGISKEVVDKYFIGTVSRINGLRLDDIAKEVLIRHDVSFNHNDLQLETGGVYQWRQKGDYHNFNPDTIHLLQHSTRTNNYAVFKKYAALIDDQNDRACTLRSKFAFQFHQPAISIDEVEPIENIVKRFATGAMSFGSISHEAHTTLAIAMNRMGAKSNSGEGGEDASRFEKKANGDWENSAIKQVASARFGVTSHYLANAQELQIKIAQGAKPGEGGQLPGHKVDDWIGRVRHATPGVGLISPPPHHDIYSIEDLKQLIFDLKNSNSNAEVSVKLVSEAGIGTVASGVAKAYSNKVTISGFDGGTGASPLSSIKHAGIPWELGLAETHQTLLKNGLRSRIRVQVDGQLRTGRDLAISALLGADEWGVATAALVVTGCIMMRKCHLNTCPVGIATQNKELRALFTGKPEHVINMFYFMAQDLREIMAKLGFKTVNEMIGNAHFLATDEKKINNSWKHKNLNLAPILYVEKNELNPTLYHSEKQFDETLDVLDRQIIKDAHLALEQQKPVHLNYQINNLNRTVGTMLSYEISKRYGAKGLEPATVKIQTKGSAGQSFGAFLARGVQLALEGDSNDYCGKGLSGGILSVYPSSKSKLNAQENIIIGNVAFYGATSGEAYIGGKSGERFAVRNSGATLVVEGVGDHGCEYMTGGTVLVLGNIGRNFAAGMSGGIAYILNKQKNVEQLLNREMVEIEPLQADDKKKIQQLLNTHFANTKSKIAQELLTEGEQIFQHCVKIISPEYRAALLQTNKKTA